ncbi:uncharacterized protein LOC113752604 [Coffea eugenioides]|uniref:uncharacterized protein LOC113752604 n=1 Tax=Coffea eugenioides TaxID=49369 RepID=UPI000F611EFB|nr:uncharacterized protein LOC113752604 [Coffea eugenioides]
MVRPMPIHVTNHENFCSLPLAIGLFISASVLVALCARHSKMLARECGNGTIENSTDSKLSPRSPLLLPKKTITNINNAADHPEGNNRGESEARGIFANPGEGFGEGGLWQKKILMGEKCQPPEFSGVLFYDSHGNRISELPRSPRAMHVGRYSS